MKKPVKQILVIKPSSLGDILHVFPALALLKRHFPEAELDFLVNPEFAPLLDFSPFPIRKKILFERKKMAGFPGVFVEFFKLFRTLRKNRYDLVIDFQGLFRSALFAGIASHRRGSVRGFAAPREKIAALFYSEKVSAKTVHAVSKNVELVNFITEKNDPVPDMDIPVHPACGDFIKQLPQDYILLIPGARWISKTFPPRLFAQVASGLRQRGYGAVFAASGSKADIAQTKEMRSHLPEDFPLLDLTGETSIPELFELIRNARAVICNDSGPMHIAALLKTPVYSFFGPTDADKTGPWQQGNRVFSLELECSRCMNRVCPEAETRCHGIDPEIVCTRITTELSPFTDRKIQQ